ncbi:DUF6247 family protein [Microlunatus parietis]|uniref:Uncharacterized protein n=1 Tax=Microlunatus parietis TaxID=682979 RepID=A0A7Y9I496_9ACTN|nr:DUF6247 family protein [Microlunatus parietis]NYE69986.1 hypothetical protein [Microlunatus parietis]
MTVSAHSEGQQPPPEPTPRAIRAALLPEEVGHFDSEFRQVMAEATESLDLTVIHSFLRRWQRVAWSSQDPAAHRQMLRNAEVLASGGDIATEPWSVTKARLGL